MYDLLTRTELSQLHASLCQWNDQQASAMIRICDAEIIPGAGSVLDTPDYRILRAAYYETFEMSSEVYAELQRRDAQADALPPYVTGAAYPTRCPDER